MPVYRYLSEKRMSMARQYIENGETLSSAALLIGFRDYSNFYRMYKCYYRDSPSKDLQRKKLQVSVS
jgi:AraC-like DNA-binding protein